MEIMAREVLKNGRSYTFIAYQIHIKIWKNL
jgi:hypothetical protein